jgi:Set1/Ash2 histone methyltransferase complex subunit ASH2
MDKNSYPVKRVRRPTEKELSRFELPQKRAHVAQTDKEQSKHEVPPKRSHSKKTYVEKEASKPENLTNKRTLSSLPKEKKSNSHAPKDTKSVSVKQYTPTVNTINDRKKIVLPSVALSEYDKAQQLHLSHDQLTVFGSEGGYRMVRATHGVHRGSYYWEVEILESPDNDNAHVRIGWSTRQGELQGPVGFDKFSFGYRDIGGSKLHNSVRVDHYGAPYAAGDIVGCFIHLDDPSNQKANKMCFYKNGGE